MTNLPVDSGYLHSCAKPPTTTSFSDVTADAARFPMSVDFQGTAGYQAGIKGLALLDPTMAALSSSSAQTLGPLPGGITVMDSPFGTVSEPFDANSDVEGGDTDDDLPLGSASSRDGGARRVVHSTARSAGTVRAAGNLAWPPVETGAVAHISHAAVAAPAHLKRNLSWEDTWRKVRCQRTKGVKQMAVRLVGLEEQQAALQATLAEVEASKGLLLRQMAAVRDKISAAAKEATWLHHMNFAQEEPGAQCRAQQLTQTQVAVAVPFPVHLSQRPASSFTGCQTFNHASAVKGHRININVRCPAVRMVTACNDVGPKAPMPQHVPTSSRGVLKFQPRDHLSNPRVAALNWDAHSANLEQKGGNANISVASGSSVWEMVVTHGAPLPSLERPSAPGFFAKNLPSQETLVASMEGGHIATQAHTSREGFFAPPAGCSRDGVAPTVTAVWGANIRGAGKGDEVLQRVASQMLQWDSGILHIGGSDGAADPLDIWQTSLSLCLDDLALPELPEL